MDEDDELAGAWRNNPGSWQRFGNEMKQAPTYDIAGLGQQPIAAMAYRRALSVANAPTDENMWLELARMLWQCGKQRAARSAVEKALALNPLLWEAHSMLDHWRKPCHSFEDALAGSLVPVVQEAMKDEVRMSLVLQCAYRVRLAWHRTHTRRAKLYKLLREMELIFRSAEVVQVVYRAWLWNDVCRWFVSQAVHVAAGCVTRVIRMRRQQLLSKKSADAKQRLVQVEFELMKLKPERDAVRQALNKKGRPLKTMLEDQNSRHRQLKDIDCALVLLTPPELVTYPDANGDLQELPPEDARPILNRLAHRYDDEIVRQTVVVEELRAQAKKLDAQWVEWERELMKGLAWLKKQNTRFRDADIFTIKGKSQKHRVPMPAHFGMTSNLLLYSMIHKLRKRVDNGTYVFVDWRTRHHLHHAWARARLSYGIPKLILPLLGPGQAVEYAKKHPGQNVGAELTPPQHGMPCVLRVTLRPDPSIRVQWYRTNRLGINVPVPEYNLLGDGSMGASYSKYADDEAGGEDTGSGEVKEEGEKENREYSAVDSGAIMHIRSFKRRDEGDYHAEISNNYGTVTTNTVSMYLPEPPCFVVEPVSTSVKLQEEVVLRAVAMGSPPIVYTWYRNGLAFLGGSSQILNFQSFAAADAGEYFCKAVNSGGEARTDTIMMIIEEDSDADDDEGYGGELSLKKIQSDQKKKQKATYGDEEENTRVGKDSNKNKHLNPVWRQEADEERALQKLLAKRKKQIEEDAEADAD